MKVYRNVVVDNSVKQQVIFEIGEANYSGTDMGERKITATIKHQTIIDFQVGDYVELDMADLLGGHGTERFYLFTLPTIKKTARSGSVGDAFEHNVTFYPAQYELNITQMRDILHQNSVEEITAENFVYTGYDEFSFFGGAHTLMRRILYVLQERFGTTGTAGIDYWDYVIAESVDEDINTALEKFQFDFSGNSVWDALCKLNLEDGVNTDFFIVGRMIYVGFKRPNILGVDSDNILQEEPFIFKYGKTSHLPIGTNHGNLFSITKSIGNTSPITRLYAYGDSRNLNRFYASDRLRSGRYVSKLMLPSFNNDGKTDWIDSIDGIKKFGIREATQSFPEIYPSLRYITYGDLRTIQYVIMLDNGGGLGTAGRIDLTTPIARIQCYRVEYDANGVSQLVRAYPKNKLAVFIHATGKTVKCVLYPSQAEQYTADFGNLPKEGTSENDATVIEGSCFCVHDDGYEDYLTTTTIRKDWFANPEDIQDRTQRHEIELHQIEYTDDYWITDVFIFDDNYPYDDQKFFSREPYSVYCYPHINKKYNNGSEASDNLAINEIVAVEPVTIVDTDMNKENGKGQKTFVIYMRDFGFMINEQAYSGQYQWLVNGEFKVNFLDGYMAGLDFTVSAKGDGVIPAYKSNGDFNTDWFVGVNKTIAMNALKMGAFWRLICNRNTDNEYSYMPNAILNPQKGDHVVFLNIYMPDLYILAAEKRLLVEAQKYLNEHDNGDITYSLDLDKVRLAQIPAFGLQMREGAVMRIVDDDLKVYTENEEVYLYSNSDGLLSEIDLSSQPTIIRKVTNIEVPFRNFNFGDIRIAELELLYEYKYKLVGIFVKNGRETINAEILDIKKSDNGLCLVTYKMPQLVFNRYGMFYVGYAIKNADELILSGILAFKQTFEFKPNKHYTIEIGIIAGEVKGNSLILTSGIDRLSSVYYPDAEITKENTEYDGVVNLTFEFDTSSAFNGKNPYYIALDFEYSNTQKVSARLLSIKESNTSSVGEYANFVDLTIDTLNIKINDSVNEYQVGGTKSSGTYSNTKGGSSKEITATVKEKRMATAWQAMSNEIKDTSIITTQNTKTNEQLANIARRNYRELESLKDNIFDPDGSISEVFLQTMLLQVGANSMNYTLDNTKVFNKTYRNVEFVEDENGKWSIHFGRDILRHYVYTEGSQLGTWSISQSETVVLDNNEVYYIALKCERNGSTGQWIIDTEQHKVDEEDDYWYFNYGIIGVAEETYRNLTETRGNVFVYGDNINAGKIVTIDGNSYFDLTGNSFQLGDKLSYKNGVLTIGGVNDSSVGSILTRLGLVESDINNLEIGGENLFDFGDPYQLEAGTSDYAFVVLLSNLQNGESYTFSCEKSECVAGTATKYSVVLYDFAADKSIQSQTLAIGNTTRSCTFDIPDGDTNYCLLIYAGITGSTAGNTVRWSNIMIQKGNTETAYQQPAWKQLYYESETNIGYVATTLIQSKVLLTNLPAGKYKAMMGIETPGAGATSTYMSNSCLVWYDASLSIPPYSDIMPSYSNRILAVTDWGEEVTLTQTANVAVYTGTKEWALKAIKGELGTIEFSADGTWSILFAHISTYVTDANLGETRALDYLKAALQGSTDVAGGLLMTNVLMLKNEKNKVTAGMSGLTGTSTDPEKVLLWGGGTYAEALKAIQGLAYLPVLLTKVGAGSNIGCLKVMSDNKTIMVTGANDTMNVVITSETSDYISKNIYNGYYYSYQYYEFIDIPIHEPQTKELLSLPLLPDQNLTLNIDDILLCTKNAATLGVYSSFEFSVQLINESTTTYVPLVAKCAILYVNYFNESTLTERWVASLRADVVFDTIAVSVASTKSEAYIGVNHSQCTPLDGKTLDSSVTYYVKYQSDMGTITRAFTTDLSEENGVTGLSVADYPITNTGAGYIKLIAADIVATDTGSCSFGKLSLFDTNGLCIIASDGITLQKGTSRFMVNISDQLNIALDGLPTDNNTEKENRLYYKEDNTGARTLMLSNPAQNS